MVGTRQALRKTLQKKRPVSPSPRAAAGQDPVQVLSKRRKNEDAASTFLKNSSTSVKKGSTCSELSSLDTSIIDSYSDSESASIIASSIRKVHSQTCSKTGSGSSRCSKTNKQTVASSGSSKVTNADKSSETSVKNILSKLPVHENLFDSKELHEHKNLIINEITEKFSRLKESLVAARGQSLANIKERMEEFSSGVGEMMELLNARLASCQKLMEDQIQRMKDAGILHKPPSHQKVQMWLDENFPCSGTATQK